MTLHVIHKLRARGIDNVKVNMDWQHLIMNGEHLAEYAALLAAEGLLGHQHANSGWGTFDDDNMVGATAFMETLELALELRRASYGDERRAARLRPLPVHRGRGRRGEAVRAPVAVHRRRRGEDRRARRCARRSSSEGRRRARTSSCTRHSARSDHAVGLDVGTTGVKAIAISPRRARCSHGRRRRIRCRRRSRGWAEQDPEDWWRASRGGARPRSTPSRRGDRPLRADARARRARRRRTASLRPAILWNDQRTAAECAEIEERVGLERLIAADGEPGAHGLHGAEAALASAHEPDVYARIAPVLAPEATTSGCA